MATKGKATVEFIRWQLTKRQPLVTECFIPAESANPAPPLGPLLGQKGINVAAFCKDFNSKTQDYVTGVPLRTFINVKPDRTYDLEIGEPDLEWLIMQAAGIRMPSSKKSYLSRPQVQNTWSPARIRCSSGENESETPAARTSLAGQMWIVFIWIRRPFGSQTWRETICGKITLRHVYEMAKMKESDKHFWQYDTQTICKQIIAKCKEMGIEVIPAQLDPDEYKLFLLKYQRAVVDKLKAEEEALTAKTLRTA